MIEERSVAASLGEDSIAAGKVAMVVSFLAVTAFMVASYGLFGLFSIVALVVNVAIIFGCYPCSRRH